jgi:hypothetical protein
MSELFIVIPEKQILIGKANNKQPFCQLNYQPILVDVPFIDTFNQNMCNYYSALYNKSEKAIKKIEYLCGKEKVTLDIYSPGAARGGTVSIVYQTTDRGNRVLFVSSKHPFNGQGHSPADQSPKYIYERIIEGLMELKIDPNNSELRWHL